MVQGRDNVLCQKQSHAVKYPKALMEQLCKITLPYSAIIISSCMDCNLQFLMTRKCLIRQATSFIHTIVCDYFIEQKHVYCLPNSPVTGVLFHQTNDTTTIFPDKYALDPQCIHIHSLAKLFFCLPDSNVTGVLFYQTNDTKYSVPAFMRCTLWKPHSKCIRIQSLDKLFFHCSILTSPQVPFCYIHIHLAKQEEDYLHP